MVRPWMLLHPLTPYILWCAYVLHCTPIYDIYLYPSVFLVHTSAIQCAPTFCVPLVQPQAMLQFPTQMHSNVLQHLVCSWSDYSFCSAHLHSEVHAYTLLCSNLSWYDLSAHMSNLICSEFLHAPGMITSAPTSCTDKLRCALYPTCNWSYYGLRSICLHSEVYSTLLLYVVVRL